MRVTGYEFKIRNRAGFRWVYLQGYGGLLGASTLAAANWKHGEEQCRFLAKVRRKLLVQAKQMRIEGGLVEWVDVDEPSKRCRKIFPVAVVAVRTLQEAEATKERMTVS